jgi:hypothetical protein
VIFLIDPTSAFFLCLPAKISGHQYLAQESDNCRPHRLQCRFSPFICTVTPARGSPVEELTFPDIFICDWASTTGADMLINENKSNPFPTVLVIGVIIVVLVYLVI